MEFIILQTSSKPSKHKIPDSKDAIQVLLQRDLISYDVPLQVIDVTSYVADINWQLF